MPCGEHANSGAVSASMVGQTAQSLQSLAVPLSCWIYIDLDFSFTALCATMAGWQELLCGP